MKITKRQLKRIIKEEKAKLTEYLSPESDAYFSAMDTLEIDIRNALANAVEAGLIIDDLEDAWQTAMSFIEQDLRAE